jgi:hypothetical protein
MNQLMLQHFNRSRELLSTTMPVEEDASEANGFEYHAQFSPDDYGLMEEGQERPEKHDRYDISVLDKKSILEMEKRLAEKMIFACPSTPMTVQSEHTSSSPRGVDDLQSFIQESFDGTATIKTIREEGEQHFGTGDEEGSEMSPEAFIEAALRQEREPSRATQIAVSDGEDDLDVGVGRDILKVGDVHSRDGVLAVASLVIEEELDEAKGRDDNVQEAEAMVTDIKLEERTCLRVLGNLMFFIVLVTGLLVGVVTLISLGADDEGMSDLGSDLSGAGVTSAPTTYRNSLGIQDQIALLFGSSTFTNASNPHYKALQWILYKDPLQLPRTATNLIQRFILVLFYFQTTQNGPWRTCNPATLNNETHTCDFMTLRWVYPELAFDTVKSNRWLSLVHECEWAGVQCLDDVVVDIKLGEYLSNMDVSLARHRPLNPIPLFHQHRRQQPFWESTLRVGILAGADDLELRSQ